MRKILRKAGAVAISFCLTLSLCGGMDVKAAETTQPELFSGESSAEIGGRAAQDIANIRFEMTETRKPDRSVIFDGNDGKSSVMVFGGICRCPRSSSALQSLAELMTEVAQDEVNFYYFNIAEATDQEVSGRLEELEIPESIYACNALDEYWDLYSRVLLPEAVDGVIQMPVIAYKDVDGQVYATTVGGVTTEQIREQMEAGGMFTGMAEPTAEPTQSPEVPDVEPTQEPTEPSQSPEVPDIESTQNPTEPTQSPEVPDIEPTQNPTEPTQSPEVPDIEPTQSPEVPDIEPTQSPEVPDIEPTQNPTEPTQSPEVPDIEPTQNPTEPTQSPDDQPVRNGWVREDGNDYWYENGVKQGTEGRGKEIYDPDSDAWYWLDSVGQGRKAVSKDVYQESEAGPWAEKADGTGKWVRYDENGHMIKGWHTNGNGTYYFDPTFGTMAKGSVEIEGVPCYFDPTTGIAVDKKWVSLDGAEYWYEKGVRQGLEGRGKEIYDPNSDAWYWLDSVDRGKKAVSKDVYQESEAGSWAEEANGTGKWVRYDASGHMIKGWDNQGGRRYYFDPVYGTMAKDVVTIDGIDQVFQVDTGVYEGELKQVVDSSALEAVRLMNQERVKNGLGELKITMRLQRAAEKRAQELASSFTHNRPDGRDCFTVLDEFQVDHWASGENIAAGYDSAARVINGWMNSQGHRANILGNYTHIGIGHYYAANTQWGHYWTQLFISR